MILRSRQFKKEDLRGLMDAEPRFEEFLSSVNQMSKTLENILNGGVGSDNLNHQIITKDIAKSQVFPVTIKSTLRGSPIGLRLIQIVKTTNKPTGEAVGAAVGVDWSVNGNAISLDGLPGISNTESYRVTLEAVGG